MSSHREAGRGKRSVAVVVFLFVITGFLGMSVGTANAAPTIDVAKMFQPVPAASSVHIGATPAAKSVTTAQAVQVVGGTSNGQALPNTVRNGKTYVTAPYPGSIASWIPTLGPYSYMDSVELGRRQEVANANAHPQAVNECDGFSQGQSVCWEGAATDGKPTHIIARGAPSGTGSGFVDSMPSNLLVTQIGTPSKLQPGDTVDFYIQDGDCWANTPAITNVIALIGCIPSTAATHYGTPGYNKFREDAVYKTAPNVTYHVQHTENGAVMLAKMINPALPKDQADMIRKIAPTPTPGVKQGLTLREVVENPAKALQPAATPAVKQNVPAPAAQPSQQWVDNGIKAAEKWANTQPAPIKQAVDQVTNFVAPKQAPAPVYHAPVQNDPPAPAYSAPVHQAADTVNDFVKQVAPQAAPMVNQAVNNFAASIGVHL